MRLVLAFTAASLALQAVAAAAPPPNKERTEACTPREFEPRATHPEGRPGAVPSQPYGNESIGSFAPQFNYDGRNVLLGVLTCEQPPTHPKDEPKTP